MKDGIKELKASKMQRLLAILEQKDGASSLDGVWKLINSALDEANPRTDTGDIWTIPAKDAPSVKRYGPDGKAIRLIAHYVYVNASGAF